MNHPPLPSGPVPFLLAQADDPRPSVPQSQEQPPASPQGGQAPAEGGGNGQGQAQQTQQTPGGGAPQPNPNQTSPPFDMFLVVGIGLLVFLIFTTWMRGSQERKQQQEREKMLKALKKGDKVSTVGGVVGTVAEMHSDKQEVVLKVDEHSNTRIRFSRSAIQSVLHAKSSGGSEGAESDEQNAEDTAPKDTAKKGSAK
jgi:preprotein translocase subunit YajC